MKSRTSIDTEPEIMDKQTLLERLRTRDTSQLHMIDEKLYETKLREVDKWPEGKCIEGDYAFLSVRAQMHHNAGQAL